MKSWSDLPFWSSQAYRDTLLYLDSHKHYPQTKDLFKPLQLTPLKKVKVVILGQDPYPSDKATGLAFSCNLSLPQMPQTLKNIFHEYTQDLKFPMPKTGNLTAWAKRGVLMINSRWSVGLEREPQSLGWSQLTDEVLDAVHAQNPQCVYILWGQSALAATGRLRGIRRVVSAHPSPLSAGRGPTPFFGSRPFSKANALLYNAKQEPINWRLP